jgi:ornithine cyclodeaminase/alanine dehydrogenase-like protein (mu-crystallin family)
MVHVFSADAVHAALPWDACAAALEAAFVAGACVPVRHAHALSDQDTLLLMPAWDSELILTKLVTVMPGAAHTVQATVVALDRATGAVRAVMDGEALTLRRTAATSALAARALCAPAPTTLLMVGTGRLAEWLVRAHVALVPGIARVLVWGRRPERARALAGRLAALHPGPSIEFDSVASLEAASRQANLISCATTSTEPLVRGDWLAEGTHLDLVGGFKPGMREVDDAAVARARVVVDTYAGALSEAGDLVQPMQRGVIDRSHVRAELAEVLRRERVVRQSAADVTLFKSVGTALEDLAAARCVLDAMGGAAGSAGGSAIAAEF